MRQFAFYSGIAMIFLFVVMGLTLIFTNAFANELGENKIYIGIGILVYAAFRAWMTKRLFTTRKNQDSE